MEKFTFSLMALLLTMVAHAADVLVTLPANVEPEEYTLAITHRVYQGEGQSVENEKKVTALVAFDGNDVYLSGLAYYFPNAYVKGTRNGDKVTFESGQFLGSDQYGNEYLTSFVIEEGRGVITPFTFIYDEETRSLEFDGNTNVSETTEKNSGGFYADVISAMYTPGGVPPLQPVVVPEGLVTKQYMLSGIYMLNQRDDNGDSYFTEEPYEKPVKIGFDGDDLYIQGLVENVPEAWAKATKNAAGQYVIPVNQYIGTTVAFNLTFDYFISAINRFNAAVDIVFTYNADTDAFACNQSIAVNGSDGSSYYWLKNVAIKSIVEREATPGAPQFTFKSEPAPYGSTTWYYADFFVPLSDVNGEPMVADKLCFVFYAKKNGETKPITFTSKQYYMLEQDITEIPYGFTDRLDIGLHTIYFEKMGENELKTWSAIGMQSIYRGMGVEHRSDIVWQDLTNFWGADTIDGLQTADATATTYYDLQGRAADGNARGLLLRRVTGADGSVKTVKVLKR